MTSSADRQPDPGPAAAPPRLRVPRPRAGEKDLAEAREPGDFDPGDLPFPDDRWPRGRPAYVIVVDQLRDRWPGQPPSLAELLETGRTRGRDPEPDLEAEP
jgi:hypothetical protein